MANIKTTQTELANFLTAYESYDIKQIISLIRERERLCNLIEVLDLSQDNNIGYYDRICEINVILMKKRLKNEP